MEQSTICTEIPVVNVDCSVDRLFYTCLVGCTNVKVDHCQNVTLLNCHDRTFSYEKNMICIGDKGDGQSFKVNFYDQRKTRGTWRSEHPRATVGIETSAKYWNHLVRRSVAAHGLSRINSVAMNKEPARRAFKRTSPVFSAAIVYSTYSLEMLTFTQTVPTQQHSLTPHAPSN